MMTVLKKLKPQFWDHRDVAAGPGKYLFNFRRIWKMVVVLMAVVTLAPLISITLIDYNVTEHAIESEVLLRTSRLVSNTRRTVSYFFAERMAALEFLVQDNSLEELNQSKRLAALLDNLKMAFGGFADLGIIDASGNQMTYVGPYKLEGKNYRDQEWFKEVLERSVHISDVFLGFRKTPHLVIAIKHTEADGSFYVLRATLDTERYNDLLSQLEMSGLGDAFIVNHQGKLQTPSLYHGKALEKMSLPVPEYSAKTQVFEGRNPEGKALIVGYAYIAETPFILMIVKQKSELMMTWNRTRTELILFLIISITVILLVILGVSTYLVERIFVADQKRVMTLHHVEYSNKMASLGRLAAGVAHEINNPLAIINEKAGLIMDLFTIKKEYTGDPKLMSLVNSVLSSVERCATITRRLLNFSRHIDISIEPLNLKEVIQDVLGFLGKEAEYRSIAVSVNVPNDIPQLVSDRGRLQEILLNLFNNAFAALSDGGRLDIAARREDKHFLSLIVTDNGCGIPERDIERVFEPFFSTKGGKGGTGLGLSITYGLVQEIGGSISVESEEGKGTSFSIRLPIKMEKKGETKTDAGIVGR